MKRFLVAMLMGSATLSAGFLDCMCGPGFEGAYGGVAVGIRTLDADITTDLISSISGEIGGSTNHHRACHKDASIDVYAGYGWILCDCLYAGGRLGFSLFDGRIKQRL
jgi:hypothetical protein